MIWFNQVYVEFDWDKRLLTWCQWYLKYNSPPAIMPIV